MLSRIRIAIPVYDNPTTVAQVVRDCLALTDLPVLVVDDGSQIPVESLLGGPLFLKATESGRLRILRHVTNLGKGAALRSAFSDSLKSGFTHLIAMDGDGQHLATEISKLVAAIDAHPWAMIVGNRTLDSNQVPKVSKFGRKFSNFWVKYETDIAVADSQCGMRAYPLFLIQSMQFWTRGFEFEIEILIRFLWKRIDVIDIPISVVYHPPEERVSHFRKFKDNVRISFLNVVLVVARLFRLGVKPRQAAIAVGLGVFIGCTPLYGLHTVIGILVALLFRLNVILLVLATHISTLPLAPFLISASIAIGSHLRNGLGLHFSHYLDWPVGSVVLGMVLGILFGAATYGVARILSRKSQNPVAWNGRMRGGVGNHFLKWVVRQLGLPCGYFCLYFVIPYFYVFAPTARRGLHEYWRRMSPNSSLMRRRVLVMRHLYKFAQLLLDRLVQADTKTPLFSFVSDGFENIRTPIESGEGIIFLSAHVGAWDLASSYAYRHQMDSPFHLLQYSPVMMADRPIGKHFALVPFLGGIAPFDTTAFKLAATTGKPLLFSFNFKGEGMKYNFYASASRYYSYKENQDRESQCSDWAAEFAKALEEKLRNYPDQWSNFYRFWSVRPASPDALGPAPNLDPKGETKIALG